MNDPYKILGVERNVDKVGLKFAYRTKAQRLHPDKEGGSQEAFADLQEAYSILKDEDSRAHYDRFGEARKEEQSMEDQAVAQIMSVFVQWMNAVMSGGKSDKSDCLREIKSSIESTLIKMRKGLQGMNQGLSKIDKLLGKFTVDDDRPNFFEGHLQSMKQQIFHKKEDLGKQIKVNEAALDLLQHFTYSPEGGIALPPVYTTMRQTGTGSAFTI